MKRILLAVFLLSACREDKPPLPAPVALSAEAVGHYCQMNLLEHDGPKAQVHLLGFAGRPLFFSQVRDAVAYARLPEQSATVLGIYVNDMGAAGATWQQPGTTNWINAETALFVVGSRQAGGMGADELIPFGDQAAAQAFIAANGGQVFGFGDVPDTAVFGEDQPVENSDGDDYMARLQRLKGEN